MNKNFYSNLKKSSLTPPSYIFGIVWPILYMLLLFYYILLINNNKCKGLCLTSLIFLLQMLLNFSWSPIFFRLQKFKWALVINILMIVLTIITMYLTLKINQNLNYLLLPYLLWITFASYLNGYIVVHNQKQ